MAHKASSSLSRPRPVPSTDKVPFDIDVVMDRVRRAVEPFPPAALFQLAQEGFNSPFEQLLACLISIRTRDEVTVPAARRLFARARTPEELLAQPTAEIAALIGASTFYTAKAEQMRRIARRVVEEFAGQLPCREDVLRSFAGVGPKCANLVLGIACGEPRIGVDIHVHRITNRWGYVETHTPEVTMVALERRLSRRYWVEINQRLVPFGKHICTGRLPRCSTCPVLDMCRQVGVGAHR